MIHTGLPYDMDILGNIDNEGAVVDMSNLNYPGIQKEDNVRVSYIYLRNTAFNNVTLDFSQTSYEFKRDFLLFYINGDIFYEIEPCTNTWIKILGLYNQQDFPIDTIFTQDELYQFIRENLTEIAKLNNIIASLPVYLFLRLNIEDPENFNFNDIEKLLIEEATIEDLFLHYYNKKRQLRFRGAYTGDRAQIRARAPAVHHRYGRLLP